MLIVASAAHLSLLTVLRTILYLILNENIIKKLNIQKLNHIKIN
jgi:hypothetical protein